MYKKNVLKSIIAILLILSTVMSPLMNAQVKAETTEILKNDTLYTDTSKAENQKSNKFIGNGYEVELAITSQWDGAFNGEVTIFNTGSSSSSRAIENWALKFEMRNKISNIWNGIIENIEGDTYTVKNNGWNCDIPVGKSVSFGFMASGDEIYYPTSYTMPISNADVNSKNYEIDFIVNSDWGSGFSAMLNLKNDTDKSIEGWVIEFDFEKEITQIWNGQIIEHIGNHYIIKNTEYNQSISPGDSVSIGFNGIDGNITEHPYNYKLHQIVIDSNDNGENNEKEYLQLPDGEIDKDYLYNAIYTNLLLLGLPTEQILLSDDYDGDGITLKEEYEYDTNPFLADTDEDGLSDYDELYIYHTNPIKWDTDEDGMSDGVEIDTGLNPLLDDSNGDGVSDSEEIVNQNIKFDTIKDIVLEETLVMPQVEITGKGDYSGKLLVEAIVNNVAVSDLDYIVGHPFEFYHDETVDFSDSRLSFFIDNSVLEEYYIEELAIAYYDLSTNSVTLLDTEYDYENSKISAYVDHFSIYFVVNIYQYISNITLKNTDPIKDSKADIVFIVNTSNKMKDALNNVKNNLVQFIDELEINNVDARYTLVEINGLYSTYPEKVKTYDWINSNEELKSLIPILETDSWYSNGNNENNDIGFGDALNCVMNMSFRNDAYKHIILISEEKGGIAQRSIDDNTDTEYNESYEFSELTLLRSKGVCFSTISSRWDNNNHYTSNLVYNTNGIKSNNINKNFLSDLKNMISGPYIKLSNGLIVKLEKDPSLGDITVDSDKDGIPDIIELGEKVTRRIYIPFANIDYSYECWTFYSNPKLVDTDGDGLLDIDDINPTIYDTVILTDTESVTVFNSGRSWYKIPCNSFDFLDNLFYMVDLKVDNPIPYEEFSYILHNVEANAKQSFNINELTYIGLIDNEGSKIYMHNKTGNIREEVFKSLSNRSSKYYRHTGTLFWEDWKEVPKGTESGFFKGAVLSESDINFSLKLFYVCDVYTVLNALNQAGVLVIALIVAIDAAPVIIANIQGLTYYCKIFGVIEGFKMYTYLGVNHLPDSVITWVQNDFADGDSSLDDLIGSNIPINKRGITGEQALKAEFPDGITHKYFAINDPAFKGGRYVDLFSLNKKIAYESKVGYTCLSKRIKTQVLKDAWLIKNKLISEAKWIFYESKITKQKGASQELIEFLERHGIMWEIK